MGSTLTTLSSIRSGWGGHSKARRPPLASIMRIWSANAAASCKEPKSSMRLVPCGCAAVALT